MKKILLLSILFIVGCEEDINKYDVRVVVDRSIYATIYVYEILINSNVIFVKTECGSGHPTLPDEEPDCLSPGSLGKIEYETTLEDGDEIGVFANTVQHLGECGTLEASIYVNDNKVISSEDDDDDCSFSSVGCSWIIN